jgi:Helix-hairpin-helix motif
MFPFWTMPQRRALLVLGGIFWVVLGVRWACDRVYLPGGPDIPSPRAAELSGKIDPNTADWQTLAGIPSMGEKRSQAIVAYRDRETTAGRGPIVFRSPHDLERIKGIGAATAANLEPYLEFPTNAALTTRPK